jgi:hypothetical protein
LICSGSFLIALILCKLALLLSCIRFNTWIGLCYSALAISIKQSKGIFASCKLSYNSLGARLWAKLMSVSNPNDKYASI